jgi:hypothetical protein
MIALDSDYAAPYAGHKSHKWAIIAQSKEEAVALQRIHAVADRGRRT